MNAIAPVARSAAVPVLTPSTFEQLVRFAELAAQSGMVPKDYIGKPGAIMVACQMGSELGLSPMQSINSIAVINGRPGVFGDALIGLCRQSPLCEDVVETLEGVGDNRTAVCVATRRGSTPTTTRFSVADAKKAGLWGKAGPWTQYPDRMLQMRARSFSLRDAFPDLLRGLKAVEELHDTPPDTFRGTTVDASPTPTAPPPSRAQSPRSPPPASTARQAINDEIPSRIMDAPPPSKRRTARDFLTELAATLDACQTIEEVDAVAQSDQVIAALGALKNGALSELNALLAEAIGRTQVDPDPGTAESVAAEAEADFPGDR
jgi:hypothetical protein